MVVTSQTTPFLVQKINNRQEQDNRCRLAVQLVLEVQMIQRLAIILEINSPNLYRWIFWHKVRGEERLKAV
ncbi:hypothetical protein KIH39_22880 [Telmatocola sphagniphila]|uniref:Uncharacterized protein n=1 Tax=Telmatocola sphagniphila TaxID=1123043 RepID=A0A8E6B5I0_9BACT|nr:hypothetical protein [Telmatocola sphagniphila]QVL31659.1 hypothetical protein KIH39_22880 [Telmatocola sphagniphila]